MRNNAIVLIILLTASNLGFGAITYSTNESGEVSYSYSSKPEFDPEPDRTFTFPVRVTGAVEISAGLNYYKDAGTRFSFLVGVSGLFYPEIETVFFTDMWAEYILVNLRWVDFTIKVGFFTYFNRERINAYPAVAIELQYWKVFIEMGFKYVPLAENKIIPIVGMGFRF